MPLFKQRESVNRPLAACGSRLRFAQPSYYCSICDLPISNISRKNKNNLQYFSQTDNLMCSSCCQIAKNINTSCIDTSNLHLLGFNLNVKVIIIVRNVRTQTTRIVTCYLPSIFNIDDIDKESLTINPCNPKVKVFVANPINEKVISVALQPNNKLVLEGRNCYEWLKSVMHNTSTNISKTKHKSRHSIKLPPIKNPKYGIPRSSLPPPPSLQLSHPLQHQSAHKHK